MSATNLQTLTTDGRKVDTNGLVDTVEDTKTVVEETAISQDETRIYPKGAELGLIGMAVGLTLVLTGLDSAIVSTAIPTITSHFKTYADVGWYSSVYRLPLCAFQFMFGKLYKTYPTKVVFLTSLAIFELGSFLCGIAPTSLSFIFGRAIAGLGAAGIIAGCFSLLTIAVPLRYRPLATGIAGTAEGISNVAAPTIGGLITEKLGWRWCFYINLPFGALVIAILMVFFKEPRRPERAVTSWRQKLNQLDLVGTAVLVPSVTCLFMGLAWAGDKYGWGNARIIVLFAIAATLLVAFAWIQFKKGDNATLPPRIILQRSICLGFLFSCCNNAALNVVSYYMPSYLQTIKGKSPSTSGLLVMPYVAGFILTVLFAGSAISVVGFYVPFMLATSTLMPIATGMMTTLKVDSSIAKFMGCSTFLGLAGGIGFQSPQFAAQTTLSEEDAHIGLAVIIFAQNFGPAIFLSAAQSVLSNRITTNLHQYAPSVDAGSLQTAGFANITVNVEPGQLGGVLQSYDMAISQTFYLSVGLTCLTMVGSLGMPWRSVKEKRS